jgi:phosphoserine phosphatase
MPDSSDHPASADHGAASQATRIADLEKLLDVARRLGATTALDPLLEAIAAAATAVLDCERASVFLLDRQAGDLVSRVATGMEDSPIHEIRFPVGVGIAGEVARSGVPSTIPDAYADPRFNPEFDRKSGFRTRNMLTVPLADHDGATVGVLQVLNKAHGPFGPRDEQLAAFLGGQAGVAVQRQLLLGHLAEKHRIERDLAVARDIQQGLLPKAAPVVAGCDVAGWNRPADETGGDYFDFVPLADGSLAFSIADATGHGIGPALVASEARALFRACATPGAALAGVVARVNDLLCADLPEGRFVTTLLGVVEPGGASVRFVSAGQGPILAFRAATGALDEYDTHGLPLGLMPEMGYDDETVVELAPGDILVLLTDGFYEWARGDGAQFGTEGVAAVLRRDHHLPAAALIQSFRAAVEAFAAGTVQGDDLTAVIVKRQA